MEYNQEDIAIQEDYYRLTGVTPPYLKEIEREPQETHPEEHDQEYMYSFGEELFGN